jgi:hypothetical protein
MFPKYHVWKNVVWAKLSTIVIFLEEKSPAKTTVCLLICPQDGERGKADCWFTKARCVVTVRERRGVGKSCEIVWRNNFPRVQKQHFYEKELSESADERYLFTYNIVG